MPKNERTQKAPPRNRIIVLEELDFIWDEGDLTKVARMWRKGFSIQSIAEEFGRDPDEILLAIIHLAKSERIDARPGGLGGIA